MTILSQGVSQDAALRQRPGFQTDSLPPIESVETKCLDRVNFSTMKRLLFNGILFSLVLLARPDVRNVNGRMSNIASGRDLIHEVSSSPGGGGFIVSGQSDAQLTSLTASVNQVLTVTAPPIGRKGNGVTDDTNSIQSAVFDACGLPNPPNRTPLKAATRAVYLPATSKCYLHSKPIRLPCKQLEFYGQGPSSGLCQNYHGQSVIQNAWGTARLAYGTSLASGPGHSLISAADIPPVIDVGRYINGTGTDNLASKAANGFNIALFVKHTAPGGIIFASRPSYPGTGNGAFNIGYHGDSPVCQVNTTGGLVTLPTCPFQIRGKTYEMELDWDKTNYRCFQGLLGGRAVLCGTLPSANAMVQSPYEVVMLPPHGHAHFWPVIGIGGDDVSMIGNLDSIRIEVASLHTVPYTVPSAKSSVDGNTYYLQNFETSLDGTQVGYTGTSGAVYSTVTGTKIGYTSGAYIHDLELCSNGNGGIGNFSGPDGLWASGGDGSIWKNLSCSNAYYSQIDLADNDYLARFENFKGFGGHVGAVLGGAFNGSKTDNNSYDGNDVACEVHQGGGGGAYENYHPICVDRGNLKYGWIEDQSSANYYYPDIDQEVANPGFVASFLLNGPSGYYFYGAGLSAETGSSFVQQDNGGLGSTLLGVHFGAFGNPSYLVKYTNGNPTTPTQLENTVNPIGVPVSNLPAFVVHDAACRGTVTLSSGAGTFSNPCIFPNDICNGQDRTTPAKPFVLASPSAGRVFRDGLENGTRTLTSATASFVRPGDVGRLVVGSGIPPNTVITSVTNSTTVLLSNAATVTSTGVSISLAASAKISSGSGTDHIAVVCQ